MQQEQYIKENIRDQFQKMETTDDLLTLINQAMQLLYPNAKNLKPIKGSVRKIRNIQITIKQFIQRNLP